jgi:hypothetical protein
MSIIQTFVSEKGDQAVITGNILWGSNFEWALKEAKEGVQNSVGMMPLDTWCWVKSYEYNMGGIWKLVKVVN